MYQCAECALRVAVTVNDKTGEITLVRLCGHDAPVVAQMASNLHGQGGAGT